MLPCVIFQKLVKKRVIDTSDSDSDSDNDESVKNTQTKVQFTQPLILKMI